MNLHAEKRDKKIKKKAQWLNKIQHQNEPKERREFGKGLLALIGVMIVAAAAFIFTRMN
jgi:hypothetical protein